MSVPAEPQAAGDHAGSALLTVIGGYLGAGKTTLINRLLAGSGDRRTAVVVTVSPLGTAMRRSSARRWR